MKRIMVLALSVGILICIHANPIVQPTVSISELYFNDDKDWTLELTFYTPNPTLEIDSLFLRTSQKRSALPKAMIPTTTKVIMLHSGDFSPAIDIRPEGDALVLEFYMDGHKLLDFLTFGDLEDACVTRLLPGHSITRVNDYDFARDKSPTLGKMYDSSGSGAFMRGTVYDASFKPVKGVTFTFDVPFTTAQDGAYSAPVYARVKEWSYIFYLHRGGWWSCAIRPIQYDLQPDSVKPTDIFLLGQLASLDAPLPSSPGALLVLYPDPSTVGSPVSFQTMLPVVSMHAELSICDVQGRIVMRQVLTQPQGAFRLPAGTHPGVYFAVIHAGSKAYGIACFLAVR